MNDMNSKKDIVLRKASMKDAELLYEWKNDKETIENSISKRGVTMEEHLKWLQGVIENPQRQLFILDVGGISVGQLRLDLEVMSTAEIKTDENDLTQNRQGKGITAEISYGLGAEYRGKGLGKVLLEEAETLAKLFHLAELTAEVLPHNVASQKLFQKLGYTEEQKKELYLYKKKFYSRKSDKIYIRADMNEVIATGHIMRCLSVADAAREMGKEAVFITADEKPVTMLRSRGYEPVILGTRWNDMEGELKTLISLIGKEGITKLLVDSYRVTKEYLAKLEEYTEVFYLDDLDAFEYPVSNVICYANYYDKLSYANYKRETKFYLGTAYMPVRKAFQNCKSKIIKERIERIMILSGGSDNYHMIENIAEMFLDDRNLQADIICGAFYPDFQGLKDKFREYPHLHFHQNVSNLEEYMENADLAISAGGTTLYELSAKGTPSISYAFADNQLKNVEQFDEEDVIPYAGDVRKDDVYGNIYGLYKKCQDPAVRKQYSERMQTVIDGGGAARIASLLL